MTSTEPTEFYVYQPFGVDRAPYIYGVGGPGFVPVRGLTKHQADAVAAALNKLLERLGVCMEANEEYQALHVPPTSEEP